MPHLAFHFYDTPTAQLPSLNEQALAGLAGDIVRLLEAHTETDTASLLLTTLVMFGNIVGTEAHSMAQGQRHMPNLFLALVGETPGTSKGSCLIQVIQLFYAIEANWAKRRIICDLRGGDPLIAFSRRELAPGLEIARAYGKAIGLKTEPVRDSRLMVTCQEFGTILKALLAGNNNLSNVLCQTWDTGTICYLTNDGTVENTYAHTSIVAHLTSQELLPILQCSQVPRFTSRFLWACTGRSRLLPHSGNPPPYGDLADRLGQAIKFARSCSESFKRDEKARDLWHQVYGDLTRHRPGPAGVATSRAAAQVLRLSLIYALLDCSSVICLSHLQSALALWQYLEESTARIFGGCAGDRTTNRILDFVREAGNDGASRTDLNALFGGHVIPPRLEASIQELQRQGLIEQRKTRTAGRTRISYVAA